MFPGMRDCFVGHQEIAEFSHAATEPWGSLRIDTGRTMARGEVGVAQISLSGLGRQSQVEVRGVEAGHLVRFQELKIVEFLAFPSWISPCRTSRDRDSGSPCVEDVHVVAIALPRG